MMFIPLFITCFVACLLCIDTTGRFTFHCLTSPLLTAFFISWPTKILPHWIKINVQFLVGEVFILFCLVDCYCQEILFTPITPQIISNVFLSNSREISEFCSSYIGFHVLLHWRILILLLLAISLLPILLFFNAPIHLNPTFKRVVITLLATCFFYEIPSTYKYSSLFCEGQNLQNIEGLIFRHYHEEMPTPIHRIAFAWYSLKQSSQTLCFIKHTTFSAQIDSCSYLSPHIFFIIGEIDNKHLSTLYGYSKLTTPQQQKRHDEGALYFFSDVVSPWNITSNVFLNIFSTWEYGMEQNIEYFPMFPILFKRAGYSVNFFSNQYLLSGLRRRATNQAGHFFLADAEMSDSLFTYRNRKSSKFDMGLVEQVVEYKSGEAWADYTLDIIHLIGQHFEYSLRYPPSYTKFTAKDYANRSLNDEAKEILRHYDNAIFYNDIVLDSLLRVYEKEEAIVVFVADHGEEVYDDMLVHGRLFQEPTASQAKQEFEVPMWIWCSESYRANHPDVVLSLEQALTKPFMTDGLPQILFSLAGISCQWCNEERNILSSKYQRKQRIIGGCSDYDVLIKEK